MKDHSSDAHKPEGHLMHIKHDLWSAGIDSRARQAHLISFLARVLLAGDDLARSSHSSREKRGGWARAIG